MIWRHHTIFAFFLWVELDKILFWGRGRQLNGSFFNVRVAVFSTFAGMWTRILLTFFWSGLEQECTLPGQLPWYHLEELHFYCPVSSVSLMGGYFFLVVGTDVCKGWAFLNTCLGTFSCISVGEMGIFASVVVSMWWCLGTVL